MDLTKYKKIFEQSAVAKIVIDKSFTIVTATTAFMANTNKTLENITGKDVFEVFPDYTTLWKGDKSVVKAIRDVIRSKSPTTLPVVRYDIQHNQEKESEIKYWQIKIVPITGDNNRVEFIILHSVDVTEHVLARIEIEDSNERYYKMLMDSPYAVSVIKGEDMVIELANDLAKERLGIKGNVIGKTIFEVIPEIKDQPVIETFRNVFRTGKTFSANEVPVKIKNKDGVLEDRFFNINFQPYRETDNTISGVTSISYEVTELVRGRQKVEESENRYRLLIEESPIATSLHTGPDLVVQYANDIMLDIWAEDNSVIGMPFIEILPEIKEQNFIDYLKEVYNTGESYTGIEEKAELYRNGKLKDFYFNFTYKAVRDQDGNVYGIHHSAMDVTEQVLAKKAIEENEETLRQLMDSMPQKISHTDADGNVIFFNRQWTKETGYSLEELQDNKWIRTLHPEDLLSLKEKWISSIEAGSAFEVECRIWNKDFGYRWNLNRAVPIKDDDGDIRMWVGSNTDIHDQKAQKEMLEKAVQQRTKDLEHANKELVLQNLKIENQKIELLNANEELKSFAYISSHDLQEPLRKIQTFSDLIRQKEKENLSVRSLNYFERIEDSAEKMRKLIKDLLSFSRINKSERFFEKIDLNKLLNEVIEDYKEEIEKKNATIEIKKVCDIKVIKFQFRQLLNNLISNALKFSKPGTPPHIQIECEVTDTDSLDIPQLDSGKKYYQIKVKDNGIGFEPKYSKRIFEVFQRLHYENTYEGSGIGLAIVKKIVDNHNGYITASSTPDKGTEFKIFIPLM